jgi:lysozyme
LQPNPVPGEQPPESSQLEPQEFDALVSFHYNTGGIAKASLTRHLNAGNRAAATQGFMSWLRPAAIRTRREAERDLFRDGRYPTGTIPVWAVDRNGRVDFSRPIQRLTEAEALSLLRPTSTPVPPTVPLPVPTQPSAAQSWWQRLVEFLTGKATS